MVDIELKGFASYHEQDVLIGPSTTSADRRSIPISPAKRIQADWAVMETLGSVVRDMIAAARVAKTLKRISEWTP